MSDNIVQRRPQTMLTYTAVSLAFAPIAGADPMMLPK